MMDLQDFLSVFLWTIAIAIIWAAVVYAAAKLIERRYPPIGKFMQVGNVRLHYVEQGNGVTVVFLHGNATMLQDFTLSDAFASEARECHAIAFDRPGFGYSTRPYARAWTPSAQADLFARAIEQLNCGPVIVIGHSWSTLVAVAMAQQRPDLVRSLVLLSGYYYPTARLDVAMAVAGAAPVIGDILRYTLFPVIGLISLPLNLRAMFAPSPIPARFRDRFPRWLMLRPWHLRATFSDGALMRRSAAALRDKYGEMRLPVFIAAGGDDKIVDAQKQSVRLATEIPGAQLRMFPGAGHMIQHSAPEQVTEVIGRALAAARSGHTPTSVA